MSTHSWDGEYESWRGCGKGPGSVMSLHRETQYRWASRSGGEAVPTSRPCCPVELSTMMDVFSPLSNMVVAELLKCGYCDLGLNFLSYLPGTE